MNDSRWPTIATAEIVYPQWGLPSLENLATGDNIFEFPRRGVAIRAQSPKLGPDGFVTSDIQERLAAIAAAHPVVFKCLGVDDITLGPSMVRASGPHLNANAVDLTPDHGTEARRQITSEGLQQMCDYADTYGADACVSAFIIAKITRALMDSAVRRTPNMYMRVGLGSTHFHVDFNQSRENTFITRVPFHGAFTPHGPCSNCDDSALYRRRVTSFFERIMTASSIYSPFAVVENLTFIKLR